MFTQQDGDCSGIEDVCNSVSLFSASPEAVIVDNFDSEPTDASANLNCGDGIIDLG